MVNAVPTIGMAVDDYYAHKNRGALALFGMETWLLTGDSIFDARAADKIGHLIARRAELAAEIEHRLSTYREQDGDAIADATRRWRRDVKNTP